MSELVGVVAAIYDRLGSNDPRVFDLLHPEIEWVTPPTLPWTVPGSVGTYRGLDELARYFAACTSHVEGLRADMDESLSLTDGRVLALGAERGVVRSTGRRFDARCAHVWSLVDGRAASLRGYIDTVTVSQAFA